MAPARVEEVGASAVSCGMKHTAVLLCDGSLIVFGKGDHGQTTVPAGFPEFQQVLAFDRVTLGLARDGHSLVRMGEVVGPPILRFDEPVHEVIVRFHEPARMQRECMRDDAGWFTRKNSGAGWRRGR